LGALWAGDGSVFRRKNGGWSLKFTNTSSRLLDQVQWILTRLGVVGIREPATRHTKSTVDIASIVIADAGAILRFAECVPIPGKKGALLAQACIDVRVMRRNSQADRLPIEITEAVTKLCVGSGVPYQSMKAQLGYRPQSKQMCRDDLATMAVTFANEEFRRLADSDVLWDEIKSIEPDGEDEVFDLSVPGPNSFAVSNVFAHNSGDVENAAEHILIGHLEVEESVSPRAETRWLKLEKNKDGPRDLERLLLPFDPVTASFGIVSGQSFSGYSAREYDDVNSYGGNA